jgi:hypothetical protein
MAVYSFLAGNVRYGEAIGEDVPFRNAYRTEEGMGVKDRKK